MTDTLQVTPRLPANTTPFEKGEDGYYTVEIKRAIATPVGGGAVVAILKLNDVRGELSEEAVNRYALTINEITQEQNSVTIPNNGMTFLMKAITTMANADNLIITLTPVEAASIYTLHLDVLAAVQIIIPRSDELFAEHCPGKHYYLTIDFDPKAPEPALTEADEAEPTPVTVEEPTPPAVEPTPEVTETPAEQPAPVAATEPSAPTETQVSEAEVTAEEPAPEQAAPEEPVSDATSVTDAPQDMTEAQLQTDAEQPIVYPESAPAPVEQNVSEAEEAPVDRIEDESDATQTVADESENVEPLTDPVDDEPALAEEAAPVSTETAEPVSEAEAGEAGSDGVTPATQL